MRRVLALVVCAFSALFSAGIVAQAAGQPPTTGDTVTTFTKTPDVRVTMRDGISIDTDEYVPSTCHPSCPVILVQTPYRKSDAAVGEYNPYFPSHGYAEIVADVRGTGSSEGYWDSFGLDEQLDGVELVHWAVHRPYSNGVVGLAGVSYSAINQFLTVEQLEGQATDSTSHDVQAILKKDRKDAGAVKAIFPIVPMSDPYRDVVFSGGNTDTGFIPLWLGLVNGLNTAPADDAQSQPAIALNVQSQHLMDVARFGAPAVTDATLGAYESMLPAQAQTFPDQAYDGPFYQNDAPLDRIESVQVPTFIVGGEYDIFQRGEPLLYRGLDLPSSQKKLLYGPWYHGNPSANLTADDGSSPVKDQQGNLIPSTNNLSLAWFDHWLKGAANGIDAFPTVETFQIGRGSWSPDTTFPATGTQYQPVYLSGPKSGAVKALYKGALTFTPGVPGSATIPWQPATGECSRSTTQWTAGLANVSNCSSDNTTSEVSGASFITTPFSQDLTISGQIMADLWVSSTRPDTTIVATLTDVDPGGNSDRITAGSQVASLNATVTTPCGAKVEGCSIYSGTVMTDPWHPYTRASQVALTPGRPTDLKVEIFPTSAVIKQGHRLRLSITTGDLPHQGPNASTLANSAGGVDTIYFGGKTPSAVYLGIVGAPASALPHTGGAAGVAAGTTQSEAAGSTTPASAAALAARASTFTGRPVPAGFRLPAGGLLAGVLLAGLLVAGGLALGRIRRPLA